jgi:hypothetical protein
MLKSSIIFAYRDKALSLQSTNDTFALLWSAQVERFEVKRVIAAQSHQPIVRAEQNSEGIAS